MPYSDEFRDLIEVARNSIDNLCLASTSESWLTLRVELAALSRRLDADMKERQATESEAQTSPPRASIGSRWQKEWRALSKPERLHRVMNAVGDQRRTINETSAVLNASRPESQWEIGYSALAPLFKELVGSGELLRVSVAPERSQARYAYKRNTEMSPEMASLDEALSEADA